MNETPLLGNSSYLYRGRGKDKQPRKARTPTADPTLQHLAQKENFALFSLASIKSQLHQVSKAPSVEKACIKGIESLVNAMINDIKEAQTARKLYKQHTKDRTLSHAKGVRK